MSYLRWGEILPSGNSSRSYVIGDPDSLVNINKGSIPYTELNLFLKEKTKLEVQLEIKKRLGLEGEELDVVCQRLFEELKFQKTYKL
jgi:hypothetical protein